MVVGKRRMGWLVLALVLGLVQLTAIAADPMTLRVRLAADIVNVDPAQLHTAADRMVAQQVSEGLVQFDWSQKAPFPVKPRLAKSYEVSANGTEIIFHLNQGIQFHQGYGELTADDVAFSLNRHLDPAVPSMERSNFVDVQSIEATDKYTIKVVLKVPTALTFVSLLAWQGSGMIVSKKAVEERGQAFQTSPIGTGPYYFEKWTPAESVVLKRFANYWGAPDWGFGAPAFEEIRLMVITDDLIALDALAKREIDVVGLTDKGGLAQAKQMKDINLIPAEGGSWQHIVYFNHKKAPMNNLEVRKALAYAVDLKVVAERLGAMQKYFPSPFNELCLGATNEFWTYEYNPDKAKSMLAAAGYSDGLKLVFIYPKVYMYEDVVLEIVRFWREIGVDVELQVIEYGVYQKTVRELKHDACLWSMTRFAPYLYAQAYLTNSPQNYFGYSNPEMDALIQAAGREGNLDKAVGLWRDVQKAISEQVVGMYPAEQVAWAAFSKDVEGLILIPFSTLVDLATARRKS